MENQKKILSEIVHYLFEDKHLVLTWGEPIVHRIGEKECTYVTEIKKEVVMSQAFGGGRAGYLTIKFSEPVEREILADILDKDGEIIFESDEGILTRDRYMGNEYFVEMRTKSLSKRLFSVKKELVKLIIKDDGGEHEPYVEARALEILEMYPLQSELHKVLIRNKEAQEKLGETCDKIIGSYGKK